MGEEEEEEADTGIKYGEMMTSEGLSELSTWCIGIGPSKNSIFDYSNPIFDSSSNLIISYQSSSLVSSAHSFDLLVDFFILFYFI